MRRSPFAVMGLPPLCRCVAGLASCPWEPRPAGEGLGPLLGTRALQPGLPVGGRPASRDTAGFPRASCLLLQVFTGRFSLRPRLVGLCCVYCYPASGGTTKRNTPVVFNSSQSENAFSSPTFFFRTPYSSAKPS